MFEHFFYCRLPFNWKDPIGYLFAFTIEYIGTLYVCTVNGCTFSFFIGTCFMLMALADDILFELIGINEHFKIYGYDLNLCEKFRAFIELQRFEKQLWKI